VRFRDATESDVTAMVAACSARNALPLDPPTRAALPSLLARLLASPAGTLTIFEDEDWHGPRLVSFTGGVFLGDAAIAEYLAAPRPALLAGVLGRLLGGESDLLTLEQIRRANSGDGLTLALFPIPLPGPAWDDAITLELRRLAPQAFLRSFGGYRLRAIYYEVFADEPAAYLQAAGYERLHDFSGLAGTAGLPADCRPRMLRLRHDGLPPSAMSVATQVFDPPPPVLGLTLAEQRVALRALDGASDRAIAAALSVSVETVRSQWRSIYLRLSEVISGIDVRPNDGPGASRGIEKRRVAIEYLRQNLQELRPSLGRGRLSRRRAGAAAESDRR
jgi:DNA-binding CsgD family transcriptional regulator